MQTNKEETKSSIDSYLKGKKWETTLLILISVGILIRLVMLLLFSSRFLLDYMLILMVILLLVMINAKLSRKPFKTKSAWKTVRNTFIVLASLVFYLDTFIAIRDIQTIITQTDESKVVSYDISQEGRRYFTTKSEDVIDKETIPAITVSGGKIVSEYEIEVDSGLMKEVK